MINIFKLPLVGCAECKLSCQLDLTRNLAAVLAVAGEKCGFCIGPNGFGRCYPRSSTQATDCTNRGLFTITASSCPIIGKCNKATSCDTCKAITGCGWCKGNNKCQLSKGTCTDTNWNPATCT